MAPQGMVIYVRYTTGYWHDTDILGRMKLNCHLILMYMSIMWEIMRAWQFWHFIWLISTCSIYNPIRMFHTMWFQMPQKLITSNYLWRLLFRLHWEKLFSITGRVASLCLYVNLVSKMLNYIGLNHISCIIVAHSAPNEKVSVPLESEHYIFDHMDSHHRNKTALSLWRIIFTIKKRCLYIRTAPGFRLLYGPCMSVPHKWMYIWWLATVN